MLANTKLIPQSIDEALKLATCLSKSNCVPEEFQNNPENTLVAILMGLEVGLKPLQALQGIAVINNRPCIWGDTLLGLVVRSGELESINEMVQGDLKTNAVATCEVTRKGRENKFIQSFSIEDAKRAGLWTTNTYQKYPQRMLQMRARSWCLRDAFADILKGLYIAEEVQDYPVEKEITPESTANVLLEEIDQELVIEGKKISIADIKEQIKAAKDQYELNRLTKEIKNGGYTEEEKTEMRKIFKEKKASLK